MKAVVFQQHGEVDVLEPMEMEESKPGPGEVKIRIAACALNHLDIWVRLGGRPVDLPMPHISGSDIAGMVEEVGPNVSGIENGMRVVVAPGVSCGQCDFCRTDRDSACRNGYKLLGFQLQGGYAEFVTVPARNVIPVSDKLTFEEWASIPLVFVTSWHMLFSRAQLQCGETVLIQAAGSGLGIAAIQLAKLAGARVITTAGSDEKLEAARELGADAVINYKTQDFVEEVKKLTDGQGVDVVFEHIGGNTFLLSLQALRRYGRLTICGVTGGAQVNLNLQDLYLRQISVHGSFMGSLTEQKTVIRLAEEGKVKPVIDKVFPLQEARAAQQRMLDRLNFGKIVLKTV